eukprot:gene2721-3018_t
MQFPVLFDVSSPALRPKIAWTCRQRLLVPQGSRGKPYPLGDDNPLALAFLGDAVWTLHVRRRFLQPPKHARLYQAAVRPFVTAEGQAQVYDRLMLTRQLLQPSEVAFLRAVRAWENVKLRQRFAGSAAAANVYRKATALEALVGHLHLHDPDRLEELMAILLPRDPASPAAPATVMPSRPPLAATMLNDNPGTGPSSNAAQASAASSVDRGKQAAAAMQQDDEG